MRSVSLSLVVCMELVSGRGNADVLKDGLAASVTQVCKAVSFPFAGKVFQSRPMGPL